MRRLLLTLHAYLGLLCAPYLLIFGLSSLHFNHHFWPDQTGDPPVVSEHRVHPPAGLSPGDQATALLDSLHLMGWVHGWTIKADSQAMRFRASHFGKFFEVSWQLPQGQVRIETLHRGWGPTLTGLHFLGERVPRAPWWVNAWQFYQDLTVYALIFWAVTGVYLFWQQRKGRKAALWVLVIASLGTFTLFTYLWLAG